MDTHSFGIRNKQARTSTNSSRFNHSESTERRSIRPCCVFRQSAVTCLGQRSLYHRYQLGTITLAVRPKRRSLSLHLLLTARVLLTTRSAHRLVGYYSVFEVLRAASEEIICRQTARSSLSATDEVVVGHHRRLDCGSRWPDCSKCQRLTWKRLWLNNCTVPYGFGFGRLVQRTVLLLFTQVQLTVIGQAGHVEEGGTFYNNKRSRGPQPWWVPTWCTSPTVMGTARRFFSLAEAVRRAV